MSAIQQAPFTDTILTEVQWSAILKLAEHFDGLNHKRYLRKDYSVISTFGTPLKASLHVLNIPSKVKIVRMYLKSGNGASVAYHTNHVDLQQGGSVSTYDTYILKQLWDLIFGIIIKEIK